MGNNEIVKKLTMLLIYLTKFDRKERLVDIKNMSWKGYSFDILNELEDDGFIFNAKSKSKYVLLSEEGEEYAKQLLERYLDKD